MLSIDDKIKKLLLDAQDRLVVAETELKDFKKKYEEEINELEIGFMKKKWTGEAKALRKARLSKLEKEKERLEKKEEDWRKHVIELQNHFTNKGGKRCNSELSYFAQ